MKKYERIESWIKHLIRSSELQPGDKLPSEHELCVKFRTSRNSVRHALSNLIHAGWVESKRGIGYFCSPHYPHLSMNIAFVCFSTSIPTVPSIIEGCDTLLYKQGFSLLLFQSQCDFSKEEQILLSLEEKPVDALIIEPVFSGEGKSNIALLQKLAAHDIPVVLVNNYFLDTHFTTIKTDEQYVGTSIVDNLYSRGHRKIGILYEDDYYPSILRAHSTIMRMQQYGLQVPNEWIIRFQSRPVGSPCCQAVSRYFEITSEHPTCFICSTDRAAITFLEQAEERNIQVPKDISLIGYGNTEAARIPGRGLTTVDYPGFFVGKSAANQVLDSLLAPETSEISTQSIFPKLIERDSVIEVKPEKPTLPEDALHL